jgi:hypothetical protein
MKTEAAKMAPGTNVQPAPEQQAGKMATPPMKTAAKKMEAGKSLQTLTFYWKD